MNIKLTNVRLSFPALFKPRAFDETQEPKFSATLLLDKKTQDSQIEMIKKAIASVAAENKAKVPAKVCLRDGSEKSDTDGYGPGVMFISSNSAKKVPVVDRDLTPLGEEDGKPYAGCYVNVTLRLWYQDNKWGKRVNAQLRAVQFVKDGEQFGDKADDPTEVFSEVTEDSEDLL